MIYTEKPHKRLLVWQKAMQLVVSIYGLANGFPSHELYRLGAQIRRAAVSVPSNIAEGLSRRTSKDKLQFLGISQSSLSEVDTQVEIAHRVGYIDENTRKTLLMSILEVQALLTGLIRATKER